MAAAADNSQLSQPLLGADAEAAAVASREGMITAASGEVWGCGVGIILCLVGSGLQWWLAAVRERKPTAAALHLPMLCRLQVAGEVLSFCRNRGIIGLQEGA